MPTVTERPGSLSAVGMVKETTFGTPLAATNFVPDTSCNMEVDPGLFYPQVMMGQKDLNIFPLYGQYKAAGQVAGPLFPTNGMPLLCAAIGQDGTLTGNGNTGTPSGAATALSSPATAGATTITTTANTGISVGHVLQVDTNTPTTTAELVTVTAISGAGPYTVTVTGAGAGGGLLFSHASAAAVQYVVGPFTHLLSTGTTNLNSLTIEKNFGGYESLQFQGSRVNKYSVKCDATNTEVNFTADVMSQGYTVLPTPSGITVVNEAPYVFAEATVNLFSTGVQQATNIQLDVENGVKDTFTMNGGHTLEFLTACTRRVSGQLDVVWNSLDDANFGYFDKMFAATNGALTLAFTHPGNAGAITFDLPEVRLSKLTSSIKMNDVIIDTLSFEADYGLGLAAGSPHTIQVQVANSSVSAYF